MTAGGGIRSGRAAPHLFVAPALAVFAFAVLLPVGITAVYSFTEWNGHGPKIFVGFANYLHALTDPIFLGSFWHIAIYIAATLVLEVAVGLVLAGIAHALRRSLWLRVAIFTPVLLPTVVVSVLWAFIYDVDFGLIHGALDFFGLLSLERIWLGDPSTALMAISVTSGWIFAGFYMTIFYAALGQVDPEVIEAARLDGTGEFRLFTRIKVPMIRSSVMVGALICITGGFQGFDLFYIMTNGGPYGATEIPTTYLVKTAFHFSDVGYGAAMSILLTAVIVGTGAIFMLAGRRRART